jgi:hypothetical protein
VPCRKGVMVNRTCNRLRQNKANLGESGRGPEAGCTNKANLRSPAGRDPAAGPIVRNKANSGSSGSSVLGPQQQQDRTGKNKREEAVQGAGMAGPFHAPGAAESDAAVRLGVRSHVPGIRRDRAPAEAAGSRKAKPAVGLPPQESADGPSAKEVRPMNRLRRTSQVHATWLGCWTGGGHMRSVHAPEPPLLFS